MDNFMEQGFIDILKQLVTEQVNAVLSDKKQFKSVLADYTRNQYPKESRFFIQAVEAGVAKAIKEADDLPSCKKAKIHELVEDYGLSPEVSAAIVDTLALVLRGDTSKSVTVTPTPTKGKLEFDDGTYEGDVANGKANGKGKITWSGGDFYEGDWVDGKKHGKGKYSLGGDFYEGDWQDDNEHGKGKKTWKDGAVYEGDWVRGLKHGKGKNTTRKGSVYEGDYVKGLEEGKGKWTFADGKVYEGDWVHGRPNGKGKMTYPDGKVEEGNYKDGEFVGK